MFSRAVPFDGYDGRDIMAKVKSGERPAISAVSCPRHVRKLVEKSWSALPRCRPSIGAVLGSLQAIRAEFSSGDWI